MVHCPNGIVVHSVGNLASTHYLGFVQTQTGDIESLGESELYLHVDSFVTLHEKKLLQNDRNLKSISRH
jgi:hypothetical protein